MHACMVRLNLQLLRFMSLDKSNFARDIGALFAMAVGFRLIGMWLLWYHSQKKQNGGALRPKRKHK